MISRTEKEQQTVLGYILGSRKVGERARLLTVLSKQFGLLSLFLMRSHDSRKKSFQNSSLFSLAEMEIQYSQKGNSWHIKEMNLLEHYSLHGDDLWLYYRLSLWAEVVIESHGLGEEVQLFSLFDKQSRAIVKTGNSRQNSLDSISVKRIFESCRFFWELTLLGGVSPNLTACERCQEREYRALFLIPPTFLTSYCQNCTPEKNHIWFSRRLLPWLEFEGTEFEEKDLNRKEIVAGDRFLITYWQAQIGKPFKVLKSGSFF